MQNFAAAPQKEGWSRAQISIILLHYKASFPLIKLEICCFEAYEGKSISNQLIPFRIDRDTHDFHALFQYMF